VAEAFGAGDVFDGHARGERDQAGLRLFKRERGLRGRWGTGLVTASHRGGPVARLAAALGDQADGLDDHALVDGLGHVVDRQEGHAHGGHRFHFHAGACGERGGGGAFDAVAGQFEIDCHGVERERMAQRDQVAGLLGGHDPGDARGGQNIALGHGAIADGGERGGDMRINPRATATRRVWALAPTSTMRAWPRASRWVRSLIARSCQTGWPVQVAAAWEARAQAFQRNSGEILRAADMAQAHARKWNDGVPIGREAIGMGGERRGAALDLVDHAGRIAAEDHIGFTHRAASASAARGRAIRRGCNRPLRRRA
jgi:hypothetical protein